MEKDEITAQILDKLILYLRIVHSIDYYNSSEYQQEDNMPYRCGVLHVRGSSLVKSDSNIVNVITGSQINSFDPNSIKKSQIAEWLRLFENHIRPYSDYHDQIELDLAKKLGLKDLKAEVDKFIKKNCQKVDKDVWLCPLSGKKFKGPDYVKKHIETKHSEKLQELKNEVEFFNKFILDPKRPYLPEHPLNRNMGKMNQMNSIGIMEDYDEYHSQSYSMMNLTPQFPGGPFYNNGPGLAGPMPVNHMLNQYGPGYASAQSMPSYRQNFSQYHNSSRSINERKKVNRNNSTNRKFRL